MSRGPHFAVINDDKPYFDPNKDPATNAQRIIEFEFYSVINCFSLLTRDACQYIATQWEVNAFDPYSPLEAEEYSARLAAAERYPSVR